MPLKVKVKEFRKDIVSKAVLVSSEMKIEEIADLFIENSRLRTLFVVDKENHYLGYITALMLNDAVLLELAGSSSLDESEYQTFYGMIEAKETAEQIMEQEPVGVSDEQSMQEAMQLMKNQELSELPVLDEDNKVVGELHVLEVLKYWKTTLK